MDGDGFDAWVRQWRTRRGALRSLVAVGAALGLPTTVRAGTPTCDPNGAPCDPLAPNTCCTGTCKQRRGKFKCAPAGAAYGCTKKMDGCRGVPPAGCPENLGGIGCAIDNKGKPLCIVSAVCAKCKRDADCTLGAGLTARCIKGCAACKKNPGHFSSACVVPAPPPP